MVVVLADDMGPWALGCAGNTELRTPNLDRLAASGIRFTDFFCTSPVCSPARASILTGRIPSQHGVHDWLCAGNCHSETDHADRRLIEYLRGQPGFTDYLAEAGYVCGISGKWHMGDSHHPQKGHSFWRVHARGGGDYMAPPMIIDQPPMVVQDRYVTDIITDHALTFLDQRIDDGQSFCLSVHYTAPHSPWARDQHPAALWDDYHNNCPFDSVPDEPIHPWSNNSLAAFFESPGRRREMLAGYYASITAMDAGIGRIIDRLDAAGLRENTLVLFLSDNGMNMGHHGICGKGNGTTPVNMYDTSVKVPAIISRPGLVPAGQVSDAMLSQYDWLPTVLDYLGLENPEAGELPGASFADLLRGRSIEGSSRVVVFDEYGPARMIRSRQWKYIHRYLDGPAELYHLADDPQERANLIDDPSRAGQVESMRAELQAWFDRYVDPATDGSRLPVSGAGQKDWARVDGDIGSQFRQRHR